jgi:UDP-N-acetylglucosamine 2-epimerase (non-hydrolysing)
MKVAPIIAAIHEHNDRVNRGLIDRSETLDYVLVHTGQHYDRKMSDSFFEDLKMPQPDVNLGVGSGSHAVQTGEIMKRFEPVLLEEAPDMVLVAGDVNSTIACSLVAAKLECGPNGKRPLIGHVESGLRSFDRAMPEECNRVMTDHLADMLFVTEGSGVVNLRREGIDPEKVFFVGNTMIDSLLASKDKAAAESTILSRLGLKNGKPGQYGLLTLHRPSNVDQREGFLSILEGISELAQQFPVVFPSHPRTLERIRKFGLQQFFVESGSVGIQNRPGIHVIEPLGYLDFLCLMMHAKIVVTDSGGIQEETTGLGVPCVTVRENTERPVTIEQGTNVLAGVEPEGIRAAVEKQLKATRKTELPEHWDGRSATRIVEAIVTKLSSGADCAAELVFEQSSATA